MIQWQARTVLAATIAAARSSRAECWWLGITTRYSTTATATATISASASASPSPSISFVVGDIASITADAITVSSNESLAGNLQTNYWRFSGRTNTNGSVRTKGGRDLDDFCSEQIRKLQLRRRHEHVDEHEDEDEQQGSSLLKVGEAVTTMAGKNIPNAKSVIHSYSSVLECAETDANAESLAIPALGCGIKGWNHRISARIAREAVEQRYNHCVSKTNSIVETSNTGGHHRGFLQHIVFVLQSASVRDVWESEFKSTGMTETRTPL
eukprot:jgi/Psemu1/284263/fgenesh1_pg.48_\